MVSPVYLLVLTIAAVFLLPVLGRLNRNAAAVLFYSVLAAASALTLFWFFRFQAGAASLDVFIAGFKGPMAIQLRLGPAESFMLALSNGIFLLSAVFMYSSLRGEKLYALNLLLLMATGINGLVLSRDLFNIFVFMEILSISTCALITMSRTGTSTSAGFKYILAAGLASAFFLTGTAFVYRAAGTLHLDHLATSAELLHQGPGFVALFLVLAALLIELKPFPANGWALDVYQTAHPGVAALISTAGTGAVLFVFYKLLPVFSPEMLKIVGAAGLVTFFFSNLTALKQDNPGRLLGYSSAAQTGLILSALALLQLFGLTGSASFYLIAGGFFFNHLAVKGVLFWLSGQAGGESLKKWASLAGSPLLLFVFGIAVAALSGLPPFAGFWAKWELLKILAGRGYYFYLAVILTGSAVEIYYLFRWFGLSFNAGTGSRAALPFSRGLPILAGTAALLAGALFFPQGPAGIEKLLLLIPAAGLVLYALDFLPGRVKNGIVLVLVAAAGVLLVPQLQGLRRIFAVMFLGGGFVQLAAGFSYPGPRRGLYPGLVMLMLSFGGLLLAKTGLGFFFAWEMMTLASYLLILRGSEKHSTPLIYLVFSSAGAFLLLAGLLLAGAGSPGALLSSLDFSNPAALYLIISGFLVKTGAVGLHLWVPGLYSESDDDVSPLLSSVLSKAGIAGIMIFMVLFADSGGRADLFYRILGWIGGLTAFFGTFMAIFQEDAKRLLAFSSMGQMGYVILAASLVTHIGWIAALYIAATHLLFKAVMFLSIGGVVYRLQTPLMYRMGGMIKRMPLSFVSFLIALIALSGVPPLTGFGGKWLLYTALIEKGWYLLAGLALFSSAAAFLYCYRIIHSVFLGQLKTRFKEVREAPFWYLLPQYIFVALIMLFSMFPRTLIGPLTAGIEGVTGGTIRWEGYTVISSLGYWNGSAVMMTTMGVFIVPLIWLLLRVKSVQKVKQFNIVYAAERPDRPETTHFAYNFFAHYTKALGYLSRPLVKQFWYGAAEWVTSLAAALRHVYSGNGQTYALHIMLYVLALYFFMK